MNPKRPFSYRKDDESGDNEKVGYDSKTREKVVLEDPSQHAGSSGPTRDEAEAWLKTKGLSKDEAGLIIVYVFDFGREAKRTVRSIANALAHKGRQWVAQKLRQPTVREFCHVVMHCHREGVPLPPLESVPGLPQPKEIKKYEAGEKETTRRLPNLHASHFPDDHPQRHIGGYSLVGCAAHAKEMLKPGGVLQDAVKRSANLKFLKSGFCQYPAGSPGLSSTFSKFEFSEEEAASTSSGDDAGGVYECLNHLFGRTARGGNFTTRGLIDAITAQGIEVPEVITEPNDPQATKEIERLNRLLSEGRRLHERFKEKIILPDEAKDLAERESSLSQDERIRLNRLILDAAFPEQCPKNRYSPFLQRKLEAGDIVPLIRMNPSWLLQEEWRLLLEAFVDLLEGAFYGDSARRVPDIAETGRRKRVAYVSNLYLNDLVKPLRGNAYNYDNESLSEILDIFVSRVLDLQAEWKIVKQRPENMATKKGLLEKFQDAHGRELQGYSLKRLKNILTDNPRIVAADLAAATTGLDASLFLRAKEKETKRLGF